MPPDDQVDQKVLKISISYGPPTRYRQRELEPGNACIKPLDRLGQRALFETNRKLPA